jgi:hypothetical protein
LNANNEFLGAFLAGLAVAFLPFLFLIVGRLAAAIHLNEIQMGLFAQAFKSPALPENRKTIALGFLGQIYLIELVVSCICAGSVLIFYFYDLIPKYCNYEIYYRDLNPFNEILFLVSFMGFWILPTYLVNIFIKRRKYNGPH